MTNVGREQEPSSPLVGLGAAVLIAVISHAVSWGLAALDPLVLSMLISIIVGNLIGPSRGFEPGIGLSHRIFIPLGIILYGTQMDLRPVMAHGTGRLLHILLMAALGLFVIERISAALGIARRAGLLLAAGTSICGASAIMVLSPLIKAEKEDTSISLLSITVVGLTGVVFYPIVQEAFSLSEETYALLCGSTLPQVGHVKAAASLMGERAVEMALPVKLLRVGMLLPVGIAYSFLGRPRAGSRFAPWFLVGFLLTAAVVNIFPPLRASQDITAPAVTFLFSIAISGIGLSVNLESIIDTGLKPLGAAFLGWLLLVALFALGSRLVG